MRVDVYSAEKHLRAAVFILAVLSFSTSFAGAEAPETFKFSKVDLELLDKVNQVDREFDRKGLVFNDPDTAAYIEEIGKKMIPEGPLENVKWRFRVLRDAEPNAFALPNGTIYIHTGLLAMLRNEAQLAAIVGHEVTHVINRHGYLENRSYRKKMTTINILAAAGGVAGGFGGIAGAAVSGVLGTLVPGVMVATIYGYSRELEREADVYALRAMARNNYPPIQMAATFELLKSGYEVRLEKEARGLYIDHPRLDERIRYVNEIADTLPLSGPPIVRPGEYTKEMEQVFRHDVSLEILTGRARTAVAVAARLKEMNPDNSEHAFLLGEAYRALGGRTPVPRPEEVTENARNATRKQLSKMTLQEYEASLRTTPEGKAAWSANVKMAEEAYNRALTLDPQNARAVRGLAFLHDEDGKAPEALEGYRKYLQLSPAALDAYRIKKRADDLEKASTASANGNTNRN
jgi:tetratricopeptide (TPR) repeat protein